LLFKIEHGPSDDLNATYEGAVFAYIAKNRESLVQTDSLQIRNAASEAAHNYSITSQTGPGVLRMIISGGMSLLSLADWEERIRG
jgi:hypothetical protein